MCTSPIKISNRFVYYDPRLHSAPRFYEVPCGHCLECRSIQRSEWQTRISFEISDLYKRGGHAIFLTFTYNDNCLPHLKVLDRPLIPCFRHSDVLGFLNKIKVYSNRTYGKGAYKYFFTSEFGSNTKRPHYHALFFLEPYVDCYAFAEKCRKYWTFGFMFPKCHNGSYVDNDGLPSGILIRSLAGGAKYVAKYVTKDLSYYDDSLISRVLSPFYDSLEDYIIRDGSTVVEYTSEPKKLVYPADLYKTSMPKHWQSKGLGSSILLGRTDSELKDMLSRGVFNPLTQRVVPCPQFIINKLMYKLIPSERFNSDGKMLYDRTLTDFGKHYFSILFDNKVRSTIDGLRSWSRTYLQYRDKLKNLDISLLDVHDLIKRCGNLDSVAIWSVAYRYCHLSELDNLLYLNGGNITDMFTLPMAYRFYITCRDSVSYRKFPPLSYNVFDSGPLHDIVFSYSLLYSIYRYCVNETRADNYFYRDFVAQGIERLKRLYSKYDNNLC